MRKEEETTQTDRGVRPEPECEAGRWLWDVRAGLQPGLHHLPVRCHGALLCLLCA